MGDPDTPMPLVPDRWIKADSLFDAALQRPADVRPAFLRAECRDDPELYDAVKALLAADADAEKTLGESATDFVSGMLDVVGREAPGLAPGTRVGAYEVVGELGRGGMGAVYRAARADGTFEKEVALKLVKRGMDTDEVLRRFRAERRILAGLDHPNVARLLDAGAHEDGRPFLVMELAEGEPITTYAAARRLGVDARLSLFEQVVEAVAYAHRRLVVHRDLKPSNILVTEAGAVKLLDFGIARLLDAGADADPLTRPEVRVLTPEYAAPEQMRGEPITTAADVYALGVVLYELLAGARPDGPDPAGPSTALTEAAAYPRGTTPDRLARRLRGDIDTLVLAALRADPDRRYASAEALLNDLRRYRGRLPLEARPDRWLYRARTFVGRHRWGVLAAAAFVALLVGSVVSLAAQQRQTAQERDRAERELAQREQVTVFLADMFDAAHPGEARGDTLTAYDILSRGAERVQADLADQPDVQAEMLGTIGGVYFGLGRFDLAEPLLRQALQTQVRLHGRDDARVAETRADLGLVLWEHGDYVGAEAQQREVVRARTTLSGATHPDVAAAQDHLALMLWEQGRYRQAEGLWRTALEIRRAALGPADPALAGGLHNLGLGLHVQGRYAEAEPLYREAIAIARSQLGAHLSTAVMLDNLSRLLAERGQPAEAEPLAREALAMRRRVGGPEHPHVAESLLYLGVVLLQTGDLETAEGLLTDARERHEVLFGEDHPLTAASLEALGRLDRRRGRPEAAEAHYRHAIAVTERALGADHPKMGLLQYRLGEALLDAGRHAEADAALDRAVEIFEATQPANYPYRVRAEAARDRAREGRGPRAGA